MSPMLAEDSLPLSHRGSLFLWTFKTVTSLQKSCKDHSEFPYTSLPICPFAHIMTMVHLSHWKSQYWYILINYILSFTWISCFPLTSFFSLRNSPEYTGHLFIMSPWTSLGCDDFSDFACFCLTTLRVSRGSGQALCRLCLHWDLSKVLIIIRVGLWVGRPHHINGTYCPTWLITVGVDLDHLAGLIFITIHCQVTLLFPLEESYSAPFTRTEWEVILHLGECAKTV